jgi:hypothetical protein
VGKAFGREAHDTNHLHASNCVSKNHSHHGSAKKSKKINQSLRGNKLSREAYILCILWRSLKQGVAENLEIIAQMDNHIAPAEAFAVATELSGRAG